MSSPHVYDVDSEALLDEEFPTGEPRGQGGPSISVSRSPFHVPTGVGINVTSDNVCTITFTYPNEEHPDRQWYPVADDASQHVRVGRYTGKILEFRFSSALARLRAGPPRFNPAASEVWCQAVLHQSRAVCRRNAEMIDLILSNMPAELRDGVIKHLEELVPKSTK